MTSEYDKLREALDEDFSASVAILAEWTRKNRTRLRHLEVGYENQPDHDPYVHAMYRKLADFGDSALAAFEDWLSRQPPKKTP